MRKRSFLLMLLWLLSGMARADSVSVSVSGLEGELAENVEARLRILRFQDQDDLEPVMIRRLHRASAEEIRTALRPFGYYRPGVESSLEERSEGGWYASYAVETGEPVRIAALRLAVRGPGDGDRALTGLVDTPGLAVGERLDHRRYEALKSRLVQTASERGYREARLVEHELRVDPEAGEARVALVMETGPRYDFGEIRIQQEILDPDFVERYVRIGAGDPFSTDELLDLQYALYDSDYFAHVSARPQDPVDLRIPVIVETEPRPRHRYSLGLGYGTDTGPRVSASWQNRRVNRRGHRLSVESQLSAIQQSVGTRYLIPLEQPASERLALSLRFTRDEPGDVVSRRAELGVNLIERVGDWTRDRYLRLSRERTEGLATLDYATLLMPGVSFTRREADDPVFPRRGYSLLFDLHGSSRSLGSDVDFLQFKAEARLIRPQGEKGRWILRGQFGTNAVGAATGLPASQRFFTGGDTSVRGYGFDDLGPVDADGEVVGGRHLITGSLEYERLFRPDWGWAAFVDAGDAFDSFGSGLEYAAGLGLRWRSPIGMLRLDLAQSLSESERNPRLHLSFGADL